VVTVRLAGPAGLARDQFAARAPAKPGTGRLRHGERLPREGSECLLPSEHASRYTSAVDLEALVRELAAAFKARGMDRRLELLRGYWRRHLHTPLDEPGAWTDAEVIAWMWAFELLPGQAYGTALAAGAKA
jgi:hypothetical protein